MDKPADPATPFREVYQHFLGVLKKHGRKDGTRAKYLYDFKRFERWLRGELTSGQSPERRHAHWPWSASSDPR